MTKIKFARRRRVRTHTKDPRLCKVYGVGFGPLIHDSGDRTHPEIRDQFLDLIRALAPAIAHDTELGENPPIVPDPGEFTPTGSMVSYHLIEPQHQEMLSKFYILVNDSISEAYKRGLADGRDLLGQLARGEITVGSFERPDRRCEVCQEILPTGNSFCTRCHADNK